MRSLSVVLALLFLGLVVGHSTQHIVGDGDDDDVIINVHLPACCSGSGSPGPSPSPSPSPTPSPTNPEVIPIGLVVPSLQDPLSQLIIGVAEYSKALLNQQVLIPENSPYRFGDLVIRPSQGTVEGGEAAINSLAQEGVEFVVGPFLCSDQEGARRALATSHLLTISPGVIGSCISTHSHKDDLFLLGSTDWYRAGALGQLANTNNLYLVSARDEPRGDSIYDALNAQFSATKTIRRLRFASGGPVSITAVRSKIIEDLATFSGPVTVIFVLTDQEVINVFPVLREQSRITQYLTANVDSATFAHPDIAAIKNALVAVDFAGVTDYTPPHTVFYSQLEFAFNFAPGGPIPLNAFTARLFDVFASLNAAWRNGFFQQARDQNIPSFRNYQFRETLGDTLATSGWLGLDEHGNRQDHSFQVRRLASDGSWTSVGQPIIVED